MSDSIFSTVVSDLQRRTHGVERQLEPGVMVARPLPLNIPDGFKPKGLHTAYKPDTLDSITHCSACGEWFLSGTMGLGEIDRGRWDEMGNVFCKKCASIQRPAIARGPVQIDVPAEYAFASLSNVDKTLRTRLNEWPAKPFLALLGLPGTGKTYALWALRKAFAAKGQFVHMYECASLRSQWAASMPQRRDEMERSWSNARLLILDDFTKAEFSEGWAQRMEILIDVRTQGHRPTIIASMHTPIEIGARCGQAIGSRMNYFHGVPVTGKDRRKAMMPLLTEDAR